MPAHPWGDDARPETPMRLMLSFALAIATAALFAGC
jgi:hypothetical protein